MRLWIGIYILLAAVLLIPGCEKLQTNSENKGFLKGVIKIGPICPVERIPPDPACLPTAETYKAYPVTIWTADGKRKIGQLYPALDGSYVTELPSGNFLVIVEQNPLIIAGGNLPASVAILPGTFTILNIEIDTGIR